MNVKNGKCIRRLSFKALKASGKRNIIAVAAIILTTLMFTSLFTVAMSLNSTYQSLMFRQCGSSAHGSFKNVTDEQAEKLAAGSRVKSAGKRITAGYINDGVFSKCPAEISFMDENSTKWSYAYPSVGKMPSEINEISMDRAALELLGIDPEPGNEITLTYQFFLNDGSQETVTDSFVLSGFWEYDSLMPVHFLNVSEQYARMMYEKINSSGSEECTMELQVMLRNPSDIETALYKTVTDLGYTCYERGDSNNIRIGANWGYTQYQAKNNLSPENIAAVAAFLILIVLSGYLIIYNIFQISVAGDIRFYGLLKTIGVTGRQLRRIIRHQGLILCAGGVPVGMLAGYITGCLISPLVFNSILDSADTVICTSPLIFVFSALFSIATVMISCRKPGKIASAVSPVEAVRYTENSSYSSRAERPSYGAGIIHMAAANIGRNKKKSILVIISLSLSVILMNTLFSFTKGFDMNKFLSFQSCTDFAVSSPAYFGFNETNARISPESVSMIENNVNILSGGCGYACSGYAYAWITPEAYRSHNKYIQSEDDINSFTNSAEYRGDLLKSKLQLSALDEGLSEKLMVSEGSIEPMKDPDSRAIVLLADPEDHDNYPKPGDEITVTYAAGVIYTDSRTGEPCDEFTPYEFYKETYTESKDVSYKVCAIAEVPYSISQKYTSIGFSAVLPYSVLKRDCNQEIYPYVFAFDVTDKEAETEAEKYLSDITDGVSSDIMYAGKETSRNEFYQFRNMFIIVGGLLCAVITAVGVLNYTNSIITGIFSRRRELAVLQAVGMTSGQLRKMLIAEGIMYACGSAFAALVFLLIFLNPVGKALENLFWFFTYKMNMIPALSAFPVFAVLGCLVPVIVYYAMRKQTVVDRLNASE